MQSKLKAEGREPDELVDFRERAAASLNGLALKFEVSGRLAHAQRLSSYAEDLYRSVYKRHPDRVLALIRFLKKRGRIDEAFALCPEAWKIASVEPMAVVSVDLLRSGKAAAE